MEEKILNEEITGNGPIEKDIAIKAMKSICKIKLINKEVNRYGTGFFVKLSDSLKCFITNYHVLNPNSIDWKIELEIWNKKKVLLNLKEQHIKFFERPIDITVIEINNLMDNFKDIEFLDYDNNYNQKGYIIYKDVDIFSIHHPLGKDAVCAVGKIINLKSNEFDHNILTEQGSSGGPIILLNNNINFLPVIGVHKLKNIKTDINSGTFIGEILKETINDFNKNNNNNLIIGEISIEKRNKLKENVNKLEGLFTQIEKPINEIKIKFEEIIKSKEDLILKVQVIFTKIRNALNFKEDQLLMDIEEKYKNNYLKEDLIEEIKRLPNKIKSSIDKGKIIEEQWDEKNFNSLINDSIIIENSIQDINKFNDNIKKSGSNKYSKIEYSIDENQINNLLNTIKNFGKITKEGDKEIVEEMKQHINEKENPDNKYYVIMNIKGWEKDQDLETLGKKIISTIKKEGLQWNTEYKLEENTFGIKKLIVSFLYEEDKISRKEIIDELKSWTDEIQSVDIVSINKSYI